MIGIYVRVSTEEQAKKGYSIQDQIYECRKKAGATEVVEYIDEGISGEFLDRPSLSRLREDVRNGIIEKVICLDPDRLSRKLMNQLIITDELERQGVELVFVNGQYAKTPEGQLFYSMRGAISEFEKAKINERMSRGRREKARQGKVVKDPKIYGYNYDKETEQLVMNEEEAQVVRYIFDLFTKPNGLVKGINGIAKYLTIKGIPTKRGANIWHRQVVRQILMNPTYMGEFYQNRWNTEGMLGNKHKNPEERVPMRQRPKEEWIAISCPVIIDELTFKHAQRLLEKSRRRWTKKSKNPYLLSGLLRCGDCGNTMTGRKAKNWGEYILEYTDRKNYAGAKNPGCGRNIRCEQLDNHVWEQIIMWLNKPDEIAVALDEMTNELLPGKTLEETEIVKIEKEMVKAKEGRKRLLKLFANGDVPEDEIRQEMRELTEHEEKLTRQLEKLKKDIDESKVFQYSDELIKEVIGYYLNKGNHDLTFEDRQEIIRKIIREIVVYEDCVEIYTF